jgi:hypothetical protein
MAYTDGKAAGRRTPGDYAGTKPAAAPSAASAQERTQGQTTKFHTYGIDAGASIQLRVDTAGKGLNVAGRPSPMALRSRDQSKPAVENPSKK